MCVGVIVDLFICMLFLQTFRAGSSQASARLLALPQRAPPHRSSIIQQEDEPAQDGKPGRVDDEPRVRVIPGLTLQCLGCVHPAQKQGFVEQAPAQARLI